MTDTAASDQITYAVQGMSCAHCEAAVRAEVEQLPGVTSAAADAASGTLTITGATTRAEVAAAVDEAGYTLAG